MVKARRLWYDEPNAVSNAMHSSQSHDAVIRIYDAAGNVIQRTSTRAEFKSVKQKQSAATR
jgi:hypothetical protein